MSNIGQGRIIKGCTKIWACAIDNNCLQYLKINIPKKDFVLHLTASRNY